jgi:hypothetical protein
MKKRFFGNCKVIILTLTLLITTLPIFNQSAKAAEIAIPNSKEDWLALVNYYRQSSDLPPVAEDPQITDGAKKHAIYLAMTDTSFQVGQYENLHSENPASPFSTPEGTKYGAGDIAWSYDSKVSAIDLWMTAPFHAIGILRENLKRVGFGKEKVGANGAYPGSYVANLAIIAGLDSQNSRTKNILFPGNKSIVYMNNFTGENPEPRESCKGDYKKFTGLPIFASLLVEPTKDLTVRLTTPNGDVISDENQLCVVNEFNFTSSDAIYGPAGRAIIASDHLVLIIPKDPLKPGTYKVSVNQGGRANIDWSFSYIDAPGIKSMAQDKDLNGISWEKPNSSDLNSMVSYLFQVKNRDGTVLSEFNTTENSLKLNSLSLPKRVDNYSYCVTPIYKVPLDPIPKCVSVKAKVQPSVKLTLPKGQNSIRVGQTANVQIFDFQFKMTAVGSNSKVCLVSWSKVRWNILLIKGQSSGSCKVSITGKGDLARESLNENLTIKVTSK